MSIKEVDWKMKIGVSFAILGFIIFLGMKIQKNQSTFENLSSQITEECSKFYYCENRTGESSSFYYIDRSRNIVRKVETQEINEWIQRSNKESKKLKKYSQTLISKVIFSNCKNEETSEKVVKTLEELRHSTENREKKERDM